jgi:Trk-type K+ transport system membrane component
MPSNDFMTSSKTDKNEVGGTTCTPAHFSSPFDSYNNYHAGRSAEMKGTSPAAKAFAAIKPHLTYFRVHLMYFVCVGLIGSFIIWLSEGAGRLEYIDALFMAFSALCVTGLSSVDLSLWRPFSQVVMFILILLGSNVFMSLVPVLIRRFYYLRYIRKKYNIGTQKKLNEFLESVNSVEYRAMKNLIFMVTSYFFTCQFVAFLIVGFHLQFGEGVEQKLKGINPWWFSLFHCVSAFNNAGFGLLSDNFVQFADDPLFLIVMSFLIILGNTGYPVAFRFYTWVLHRVSGRQSALVGAFKFLLSFPRRCFTHMFSSIETKVLLFVLVSSTLLEMILFFILDWNEPFLAPYAHGHRVIIGWFQSVSTRTAGFNCIDLSLVSPAMLIIYTGFMFLSSYPTAIAIRQSGKKDSPSQTGADELAYFESSMESKPAAGTEKSTEVVKAAPAAEPVANTTQAQHPTQARGVEDEAKRLVIRDITFLYLALVAIALQENDRLRDDPNFTVFKIIFELVSGYGTVGLTIGYPGISMSFSGAMRPFSKFVVALIMLLGRHRGLPDSIDKAVKVPGVQQPVDLNEVGDTATMMVAMHKDSQHVTLGPDSKGAARRDLPPLLIFTDAEDPVASHVRSPWYPRTIVIRGHPESLSTGSSTRDGTPRPSFDRSSFDRPSGAALDIQSSLSMNIIAEPVGKTQIRQQVRQNGFRGVDERALEDAYGVFMGHEVMDVVIDECEMSDHSDKKLVSKDGERKSTSSPTSTAASEAGSSEGGVERNSLDVHPRPPRRPAQPKALPLVRSISSLSVLEEMHSHQAAARNLQPAMQVRRSFDKQRESCPPAQSDSKQE